MSPAETPYADVFMNTDQNIPLIVVLSVAALLGIGVALWGKFYLNNWKSVTVGAILFILAAGGVGVTQLIHSSTEAQVVSNMQKNVKEKYNAELWVDDIPKVDDREKPQTYTAKFIDGGKTEYKFSFDRNTNEPSLTMP
jgi:hypothetical protein